MHDELNDIFFKFCEWQYRAPPGCELFNMYTGMYFN